MRVLKILFSIDGRIDRLTYVAVMLGTILYARSACTISTNPAGGCWCR
jgi:hypothetical protein